MPEQSATPSTGRRRFLKSLTAITVAGGLPAMTSHAQTLPTTHETNHRPSWLSILEKLARPVLTALAAGQLKKTMPVESAKGAKRAEFTHLEAFGRLLAGIAPWLAAKNSEADEAKLQTEMIRLAQVSLQNATDPASPDFLNFDSGAQAIVDTAFLAQAILRAPEVLWHSLDDRLQQQVIAALESSRKIAAPTKNNWVMFAAMIEAALLKMGRPTQAERLEDSVNHMLSWYKGDGLYGDGNIFHADYYNSFVIQPMLMDVLTVLQEQDSRFRVAHEAVLKRAVRGAELLERLIAPDGSFPCIGRSMSYRFGVFQLLSQMALRKSLPSAVKPAQVRCALTTTLSRMIDAPGTFDTSGWLQIGFVGHQPLMGESYISTGSLYLCSVALLPLGLPASDPFWSDAPEPWTSQRLWSGQPMVADHALNDATNVEIPQLLQR